MKEALFWKKDGDTIVCELCPRRCVLKDEQVGACGVRQARDGTLYAMTYGKPCTTHVDPVEKKPLFHFYPGSPIFSIATIGCNLFCDFCQNWQISKERIREVEQEREVSPEKVIKLAQREGCRLIAFTYTEPTIYYEYMLAIAKLAKKEGIQCVIVSNGHIMEQPLKELIPFISAANIDLKGTKEFYRKRCKVPDYEQIKKTILTLKKASVHVEVTNLLVPGENDGDEEIGRLAAWIAEAAGRETPLHFSAFHPDYKMLETPRTPLATLERAKEIAKHRLDYVYLGNVGGVDNNTYCPKCGEVCIEQPQYAGTSKLKGNMCPECAYEISGRYEE